jgi:hypothetical protein
MQVAVGARQAQRRGLVVIAGLVDVDGAVID